MTEWTELLARYFRRTSDGSAYELVERTLEPAMFVLSLLFVPVLLGPMLTDMSPASESAFDAVAWAIWGAFVLEYVWLLYLAPSRRQMVRTHKLDLFIVLFPLLRPLRFLRVLRISTAASGMGRAVAALRRIGGRPGFQPFFATVALVIVVGAGLGLAFEHEQPGSGLNNIGDAIWWSIVTCTTVGYGDHFPVTTGGRLVAGVLMLVGIAGLSVLTASVAALFVKEDEEPSLNELRAQLDRIETLLGSTGGAPTLEHSALKAHYDVAD